MPKKQQQKRASLYRVAYEGQIITEPLNYETAAQIAVDENIDAFNQGHYPLAEVVIADGSQ